MADHSTIELSSHHADKQTSREAKGKAPLLGGAKPYPEPVARGGYKRGLAIFDLILRICGAAAAVGATAAMASTEQTLPFFTQFFQFHAQYDDIPAFQFFAIAMAIASGYLFLSIPFSIVCIMRPHAFGPKMLLVALDTVFVALVTAAASSAASMVYLAHNGNPDANWLPICQPFNDFCQGTSGAVVASFVADIILMLLVVLSPFVLRKY